MYDVTATGELLIDFTRNGLSEQNNRIYEANPGGAPCNVLAMLGKLGYKTAFFCRSGSIRRRCRTRIIRYGHVK